MNNTDEQLLDEQLCFEIYQAHKNFNRFYAQILKPWGLTYTQYIVMLTLFEHETMSVKELGARVLLDSGTLTPLLRRLEKDKWVVKKKSKEDERRLEVSPSLYAKEQKPEIFRRVAGCMRMLHLTDQEYADYMNRVSDINRDVLKAKDEI